MKKKIVLGKNKRRMLERKGSLDYVSLQGLSTQTSCDPEDLDTFLLKELVDNALDASEGTTPKIEVSFNTETPFLNLSVADNGTGLTETDVERIVDFERSYSTKFHYKFPTRGALGNAMKCVLGSPYALADGQKVEFPRPPIQIKSKGKAYEIKLDIDRIAEKVSADSSTSEISFDYGTGVTVTLPVQNDKWGLKDEYMQMMWSYAIFNPEATIGIMIKHPSLESFNKTYPLICEKRNRFTGLSSIHWYTKSEFRELVDAIIRDVRTGGKDEPLSWLIRQFRGLSSHEKISQILDGIGKEKEGIPHLSYLAGQDELVFKLHELMKKVSYKPSPDVLGQISKKCILNRIEQIYGSPLRFKYKKVKEIYKDKARLVPFVLEVALAIFDHDIGLQIHTGINHSPCLDNPFDGYHVEWEDRKGKVQEALIMRGLLEKYKIDSKQPVVIVAHLICPNIEYQSYGKGRINLEPFYRTIAQVLTDVCRFYPRSRRRKWTGSGKTSIARVYLRKELLRRWNLLQQLGEVPENERSTQQGIHYKVRSQLGGEIDIKRESFISALKEECINMGVDLSYREKLGIFAAERAQLFFKGNTYPVNWERIQHLATMGCDVILIEKEGVCTILEPYANRKGIALLNSRGFATEYAQQLLELSNTLRSNLFLLTDYDASGLLIAQKLSDIPRLGIDPQMISKLGLKRQDLEEKYKAPKKHLDPLPPNLKTDIGEKRVEIDAVLAAIGPEIFWSYLEQKMIELAPQRDLTRSVDLSVELPPEILDPLVKIREFILSICAPKKQDVQIKLTSWRNGFIEIRKVEKAFQKKIIKILRKDVRIQELAKQLEELANNISKNSQKTRSK